MRKSRPARSLSKKTKMVFNLNKHSLVPKHSKTSEAEKKKLFETFQIVGNALPKICIKDSAINKLEVKAGDIIKIERESKTAGTAIYYRVVVNE